MDPDLGQGARAHRHPHVYAYERLAGRRRMVTLRMPQRRDAQGGPARPPPGFA